ncbi:MAG: transcription termination factor NusA [Planctomycetia bacterium]|nr:transcription termination factor NusA [Planctomycetia bacterium]
MNPDEVLRIVDQIHLERKIDKEIVFVGIEQALVVAARKQSMDTATVVVHIDRQTGQISAYRDGIPMTTSEIAERIGAQTAKQVMIQKIREAERDAIYDDYYEQIGTMVNGTVYRNEGATTVVTLSNLEALLPRSEKMPGESFRPGERINAVIVEVKKSGTKVKVILSRVRPIFLERLFEQEVPEISDGIIQIRAISREAGHRAKVAVSCSDPRIDSVGACIGLRRSRIRNITEELGNERIDIVAWSNDKEQFIPKALQPATVDEVIFCSMLGRAIVLVQKDQRSLAIGRKGQNVRLASKLCDWDIEIMTRDELDDLLSKAIESFSRIPELAPELADRLVGEGFLTFDDLSIIEPEALMEMGNLTAEQADVIVEKAEALAEEEEDRPTNQTEEEMPPRRNVAAAEPAREKEEPAAPDNEAAESAPASTEES